MSISTFAIQLPILACPAGVPKEEPLAAFATFLFQFFSKLFNSADNGIVFTAIVLTLLTLTIAFWLWVFVKVLLGKNFRKSIYNTLGLHVQKDISMMDFLLPFVLIGFAFLLKSNPAVRSIEFCSAGEFIGILGEMVDNNRWYLIYLSALYLGIIATYSIIDKLFKKMAMRSAFFQEREAFKDLESFFQADLTTEKESLKDKLLEIAGDIEKISTLGFDTSEEKRKVNELASRVHESEKFMNAKKFETAKEVMGELKNECSQLVQDLEDKKYMFGTHEKVLRRLKELTTMLEGDLQKAKEIGMKDAEEEIKNYLIFANELIVKMGESPNAGKFEETMRILEKAAKDGEEAAERIEKRLKETEKTTGISFPCPSCGEPLALTEEGCRNCGTNIREYLIKTDFQLLAEIDEIKLLLQEEDMKTELEILENMEVMARNITKEKDTRMLAVKLKDLGMKFLEFKKKVEGLREAKRHMKKEKKELMILYDQVMDLKIKTSSKIPIDKIDHVLSEIDELEGKNYEKALMKAREQKDKWEEVKKELGTQVEEETQLKEKLEDMRKEITIAKDIVLQARSYDIDTELYDEVIRGLERRSYENITLKEVYESIFTIRKLTEELSIKINSEIRVKEKVHEFYAKIEELRDKIKECKVQEIAAEQEEKMLEEISSQDRGTLEKIERLNQIVSQILSNLDEKLRIAEKWKEWERTIENVLKMKNAAGENDLTIIPSDWRIWAMHRFALAHGGEGIILEGTGLMKIQPKAFNLEEIHSSVGLLLTIKGIYGIVISRRDGIPIYSNVDNAELVSAMVSKLVATASMVSGELEKGKVKTVLLNSPEKTLISIVEKNIILTCIASRKIDMGIIMENLKVIGEKLKS